MTSFLFEELAVKSLKVNVNDVVFKICIDQIYTASASQWVGSLLWYFPDFKLIISSFPSFNSFLNKNLHGSNNSFYLLENVWLYDFWTVSVISIITVLNNIGLLVLNNRASCHTQRSKTDTQESYLKPSQSFLSQLSLTKLLLNQWVFVYFWRLTHFHGILLTVPRL